MSPPPQHYPDRRPAGQARCQARTEASSQAPAHRGRVACPGAPTTPDDGPATLEAPTDDERGPGIENGKGTEGGYMGARDK